jgi:ABC-type transporter Mla subunit MlaD
MALRVAALAAAVLAAAAFAVAVAGCGSERDEPNALAIDVVGPASLRKGEPVYIADTRVGTVKAFEHDRGPLLLIHTGIDKAGFPRLGAQTRALIERGKIVLLPGSETARRLRSGSVLPATQARVLAH